MPVLAAMDYSSNKKIKETPLSDHDWQSIQIQFRATRRMRKSIIKTVDSLYEQGMADSTSMSAYIKAAIQEKLNKDRQRLAGRNLKPVRMMKTRGS